MEIRIFEDYPGMSAAAAEMIVATIHHKPKAVLCFATGDTPKETYRVLAERLTKEQTDLSQLFIIGLDEWINIPPGNTGSCHYFLHHYLLKPLRLSPRQYHLFDAMTTDAQAECDRMNEWIALKGGIDLALVGVGLNGHVGLNEPGADPYGLAHVAPLAEMTKKIGQKYFTEKVTIDRGLTLGLGQVMEARALIMEANGSKKAPIIREAVEGPISNRVPASMLRDHPNSYLLLDKEAAAALSEKEQWS